MGKGSKDKKLKSDSNFESDNGSGANLSHPTHTAVKTKYEKSDILEELLDSNGITGERRECINQ